MSSPVQIVVDSSADIPQDIAEGLNIRVIPLAIHFGTQAYREGEGITTREFYSRLVAEPSIIPKTSHPSQGEFEAMYSDLLTGAGSVVSLHVSASLSGTYETALAAVRALGDDVPISVVDSRNVSMCLGWIAIAAGRAAKQGATRDEIVAQVQDMIPRAHIPAFLDTLEFIRHSGRIGKARAYLGTLLNIKPVVHVEGGELVPLEKVRTRKRALRRLVELARQYAPFEDLAVVHTNREETAVEVADMLGEDYPRDRMLVVEAGIALGCHIGPGAVGVSCVSKA